MQPLRTRLVMRPCGELALPPVENWGMGSLPEAKPNQNARAASRAATGDALPPITGTIFQANPQLPSPSGPVSLAKGSRYG